MKKCLLLSLFINLKLFAQSPKIEAIAGTSENVDAVKGVLLNKSPSAAIPENAEAGIRGINHSENSIGYGIFGQHLGGGTGVYGKSNGGKGIAGYTNYGHAVFGVSAYPGSYAGYFTSVFGGTAGYFASLDKALIAMGKVGIGTETPSSQMEVVTGASENIGAVKGILLNKSPNSVAIPEDAEAGIRGINHSENSIGYGIFGEHLGGGTGVYGKSNGGKGIAGYTNYGHAVSGVSAYPGSYAGYFTSVFGGTAGYFASLDKALIAMGKVGIGTETPSSQMDIKGSVNFTHFYFGANEDTYIRGGKAGAKVIINDVANSGSVGIGLNNPNELLDVNGRMRIRHNVNTSGVWMSNSTNSLGNNDGAFYGMKTDTETGLFIGGTWRFWVNNLGNGYLNGSLIQTSDKRLKTDFVPLANSLSMLSQLKGYHFKWKETARSQELQTGLIAQEVQTLFPELVQSDEKGFLSVNYIGLVPHLIEAVKELRKENERLTNKNQTLESRLDKIEAMLMSARSSTETLSVNK